MEEESEANTRLERKRNEALAPLRGAQLRDYVNAIRSTLYNERLREKKEKYNETVLKYDISKYLVCAFPCVIGLLLPHFAGRRNTRRSCTRHD